MYTPFFLQSLLLFCSLIQDAVQSESCEVTPMSYRYKEGTFLHSDVLFSSCNSSNIQSQTYLTCSRAIIRDRMKGPQTYSEATANDYYEWFTSGGQIEFTFSQNISFTRIIVYFYVNENPNFALPKLRVLSRYEKQFPECTVKRTSGNIDKSFDQVLLRNNPQLGRNMREISVAGTSDALLLCVLPAKLQSLALTEVEFCTKGKPDL